MHLGRAYPYQLDRWVLSGQMWPGFTPRRLRVVFPLLIVDGFSRWSLLDQASDSWAIDASREKITYTFPFGVLDVVNKLTVEMVGSPFNKSVRFTYVGAIVTGALITFTVDIKAPRFVFQWGFATTIHYFLGVLNVANIDSVVNVRPLVWNEQGPPADEYHIGQWLADPTAP